MPFISDADAQRLIQEVDTAKTVAELHALTARFCELHATTPDDMPEWLAERIADRVRAIDEEGSD
jgi:hypothetical protein